MERTQSLPILSSNEVSKDTTFIAVDTEGNPEVEVAGIAVKANKVVGVFHDFPYQPYELTRNDHYARQFIHGVEWQLSCSRNKNWLQRWSAWRDYFEGYPLVANYGCKEEAIFKEPVIKNPLLPWLDRQYKSSHRIARYMKEEAKPILVARCWKDINHREFVDSKVPWACKENMRVKWEFGHHCALYNALEVAIERVHKNFDHMSLRPIDISFEGNYFKLYNVHDVFDKRKCKTLVET